MPKIIDETQIFAAAIQILMSLGYDRATTKEIANIAGVNEVTLFRKYGSKAGLFEKAIAYLLAATPLNRLHYTGDLGADLLAIVEAYLETNETYGDIVQILLLELPRNPDLRSSIDTPLKNLQGAIEILQKYQQQGVLKPEPPMASLSALIGPVMVHQMFRRAQLNLPVPAIDPKFHVESFLNGRKAK